MKKRKANRYVMLIVMFINMISVGGSYAWSVFGAPLSEATGWEFSRVTVAYSLLLFFLAFMGIIGGKLLDRFGPKITMTIGIIGWSFGWILSGFAPNVIFLWLTFGAMCGIFGSLFYNPAVTTAVRWFPDKRGFASGMVVGSCGLAPLLLAPVANALLAQFGVMNAFRYLGLAFLIVGLVTTWILRNPTEEETAEIMEKTMARQQKKQSNVQPQKKALTETNWKGMFSDKIFYVMWLAFFCGAFSGIMIIGHVTGIGRELAGASATQAAWMVGIMAVANFLGRLMMGSVSDKIGRYPTLMIAMAVNVIDMLALTQIHSFIGFVVTLVIAGICFGAVLSIFPTITSEVFGLKKMGENYGIMFTAYGISALFGPSLAARFVENSGSYVQAFLISALISAVALILVVVIRSMVRKRSTVKSPEGQMGLIHGTDTDLREHMGA